MKNIGLNRAGSPRAIFVRTSAFFKQIAKAATLCAAAVLIPAAGYAQSEARMCLHIPEGHNFDSDSPFMVIVRPEGWSPPTSPVSHFDKAFFGANDIKLVLNDPGLSLEKLRDSSLFVSITGPTLKVGYNCKVFPLGSSVGRAIDNFPLTADTTIDAVLYGDNDFCANELYIQKIKDGVLQSTARFLAPHQRCWGDDFDDAQAVYTFKARSFKDERNLKFVSAEGKWEVICRTYECDKTDSVTIGFSVKTGETLTNSSSTTVKKEVSVGLESGGFSAGGSMSKETTTSVSRSVSTDIENSQVKSTTVSLGYSPEVRNKFGVVSVWEYIIYSTMSDGSVVAVPSGFRGCSNSNNAPAFGPGSADTDLSCQGSLNAAHCAQEGGTCAFSTPGQYRVFFGVPGTAVSAVADTKIACNTANFGGTDPVPGVEKQCWGYPIR